jgi:hypothetical protein
MRSFLPWCALVAATLLSFSAGTRAELQPGTFLAVTQGSTSATWRIHVVDRSHRSIQTLAIGGITWSGRAPYRVFIEDDKHFLIGVMQGRPAIWRASWTGSSWHATQLAALNASPVPVLWDIERIGPWIYMSTSSSGNNAYDGIVWRLSAAAPTGFSRWAQLGSNGVQGLPHALVAVGRELHVFMWNSTTLTGGRHVSLDTGQAVPSIAPHGSLPQSSYRCGSALPVLPTDAVYDEHVRQIIICGRMADLVWRTPQGAHVRQRSLGGPLTCAPPQSRWLESMALDTDTGSLFCGSADRDLHEQLAHDANSVLSAMQFSTLPTGTYVRAMEYIATGSRYRRFSPGCPDGNAEIPCSYVTSPPSSPNPRFELCVRSSSSIAVLMLSTLRMPNPVPLGQVGAPGCSLGISPIWFIPTTTPASGGRGGLMLKLPLPSALPSPIGLHTQWLVPSMTNSLGLVFSDTRSM